MFHLKQTFDYFLGLLCLPILTLLISSCSTILFNDPQPLHGVEVFSIPSYLQGNYYSEEETETAAGWKFQPFKKTAKLEIHSTHIILRSYSDTAQYREKVYTFHGENSSVIRQTQSYTVINLAEKQGEHIIGFLPFILDRTNDTLINCYFPYTPWDRSSRKKYENAYDLQLDESYKLIQLHLTRSDLHTITKGSSNLFCKLYRKKDHFLILDPERGFPEDSLPKMNGVQTEREKKHQIRSIRHHEQHQIREDQHWKQKIDHFWAETNKLKSRDFKAFSYFVSYRTYSSPQNGEAISYQEYQFLLENTENPDEIRSIITSHLSANKNSNQNYELTGVYLVKPEIKDHFDTKSTVTEEINGKKIQFTSSVSMEDVQAFLLTNLPIDESFFIMENGNHLSKREIRRRLKIIAMLSSL